MEMMQELVVIWKLRAKTVYDFLEQVLDFGGSRVMVLSFPYRVHS